MSVAHVETVIAYIDSKAQRQSPDCETRKVIIKRKRKRKGKGREGKERKGKERKGKERKGKGRKGQERKGQERKGKERKGKERKDPLFIEGNTFTSIGCTLPCGPYH